jgi:hypothetical protein
MTKRVLMTALLSISLIALVGSQAAAHYSGYIAGVHVASLVCEQGIRGVGNLEDGDALVTCKLTELQLESKCINPAGQEVLGEAAFQGALAGEEELTTDNVTGKGKATSEVSLDVLQVCTPEIACVNPNWTIDTCIVRSMTAEHKVFKCDGDGDCDEIDPDTDTPNSIILQECVLPPEYDANNPPPPPDPVTGDRVDYLCTTTEIDHVL